jgi:hypothetical protein
VGTDAHGDQDFRLDGAVFVAAVFGGEFFGVALGVGVGHLAVGLFQRGHHLGGALEDPDRLAAPLDSAHFARLQRGNINFDWSACRFRSLGRLEGAYQDTGSGQSNHATCRACCGDQATTARIDLLIVTHTKPQSSNCEIVIMRQPSFQQP